MKRKTGVYILLLLLWWVMGCEFKVPTLPRLPKRWNSKLILPLLSKTYSFQDLVYDSSVTSNNPIFADTSTQKLYYLAVDTPGQSVTIKSYNIAGIEINKEIELAKSINAKLNDLVPQYNDKVLGAISRDRCYVKKGILNADAGTGINNALISATISDTLNNEMDIAVIARNFRNSDTDTLWIDTLHFPVNTLNVQTTMDLSGDSLFSKNRSSYIDSLEFGLAIIIRDTLRENLTQSLEVNIEVGALHLDSFLGRAVASNYLTGQEMISSPDGAENIVFQSANADFTLDDIGDFDSIRIVLTGKSLTGSDVSIDTSFIISGATFQVDLASIMAVLPDSIIFYVEAAQPLAEYDGSEIIVPLVIGYQIYAPLQITLPEEMLLTAGRATRFFIKDSTTRSNISRSQNGAMFEVSITNRTPFQGSMILLIGNQQYFPLDSTEVENYTGFEYINDTLYYISSDTERVLIDTLAIISLPLSTMEDDSFLIIGQSDQVYFADSSALSLIADTCYFLPKFHLLNPDTSQVYLQSDYSIQIKSYLNLLFDPSILNQTADTTDTTG